MGIDPCTGCGAPIAWSYCGACLAANPPGATRCATCNRSLHAGPASLPDRFPCPRCEGAMTQGEIRGLLVHQCGSCRGTFVDSANLRKLEELEAPPATVAIAPGRIPKGGRHAAPVVYIRCPGCAEVMNRIQFGRFSGIVVDVCREHGTFFDADEMERAREFIAAGGLEAAKKRVAEETAAEDREARAARRKAARKAGKASAAAVATAAVAPATTPEDALWYVARELRRWLRAR
jgi:Zn-finger nucleic acid-binding protein